MTTKEFWDAYMNSKNILNIFDITCEFFSHELSKDFLKNYDVGEVILETRGKHETAKEFDKVLIFTELLREKQPALYEEYFQYFEDFLVDYYCFNRYRIEAEESFTFFSDNPEQDFDILLIAFKKLLFYQHHDILNRTIKNIYDTINNSYKLVEGAGLDLALYKFDINLEYYFDKAEHKGFNRNEFAKSLLPYGFKLQETTLSAIENGLFNFELSPEHLIDSFKKQRIVFYQTIQCLFQREMADKHFNFVLSGTLWNKMLNFWDEQNNKQKSKPDEFFAVHADKFEKYLAKLAGDFFIDNKSEMIAVLWGSVYIYDFLLSKGMICQETFNSFKNTSRILKGKVIGQYTDILWNSDFIHQWEKPDSISEIEFQEEGKIFQKSFLIKPDKFSKLQSSIAEELEKIGELSCFIIKGGAND